MVPLVISWWLHVGRNGWIWDTYPDCLDLLGPGLFTRMSIDGSICPQCYPITGIVVNWSIPLFACNTHFLCCNIAMQCNYYSCAIDIIVLGSAVIIIGSSSPYLQWIALSITAHLLFGVIICKVTCWNPSSKIDWARIRTTESLRRSPC